MAILNNDESCLYINDEEGMSILRVYFDNDEGVNELNFVLFSTNGVCGSPVSLEQVERCVMDCETVAHSKTNLSDDFKYSISQQVDGLSPEDLSLNLTYLIVKPRVVQLVTGNCSPKTESDFNFLKKIQKDSWETVQSIGMS